MCCGKTNSRTITVPKGTSYLDNFSFLTTKQLVKKGKYVYCYKCQKYHTQGEMEICKNEEKK